MFLIASILKCFPIKISKIIEDIFNKKDVNINNLEEIRIRVNAPIILKIGNNEEKIDYIVSQDEILEILQHICENSIYAYQNEICKRIYNNKRWA